MMRQFALGLLILIAAPTIAWSDAADDAEAEAKCMTLLSRGAQCVEWYWLVDDEAQTGECPKSEESFSHTTCIENRGEGLADCKSVFIRSPAPHCECNRKAYQDFGVVERIKYHRCK